MFAIYFVHFSWKIEFCWFLSILVNSCQFWTIFSFWFTTTERMFFKQVGRFELWILTRAKQRVSPSFGLRYNSSLNVNPFTFWKQRLQPKFCQIFDGSPSASFSSKKIWDWWMINVFNKVQTMCPTWKIVIITYAFKRELHKRTTHKSNKSWLVYNFCSFSYLVFLESVRVLIFQCYKRNSYFFL